MNVSSATLECLKKSDWNTTKCIDITPYEEALRSEGYKIGNFVREFLKRFGGMELIHPAFRVPDTFDKSHFDPIRAINGIYREKVVEYEERVGEPLTLVGEAYNRHLVLLMSESGKVYGAYDDFLTKLGDDFCQALDALCESKETPEVG